MTNTRNTRARTNTTKHAQTDQHSTQSPPKPRAHTTSPKHAQMGTSTKLNLRSSPGQDGFAQFRVNPRKSVLEKYAQPNTMLKFQSFSVPVLYNAQRHARVSVVFRSSFVQRTTPGSRFSRFPFQFCTTLRQTRREPPKHTCDKHRWRCAVSRKKTGVSVGHRNFDVSRVPNQRGNILAKQRQHPVGGIMRLWAFAVAVCLVAWCVENANFNGTGATARQAKTKQHNAQRAHPDLNQGPADLQSAALTTELCTQMPSNH